MAGPTDFTGQTISESYQRVLQISSSGELTDGTGSIVILGSSSGISTASFAITASYAVSASHEITYELSSSFADTAISSSYALTASFVDGLTGTNSGDVTLTGTPDYITIVGQEITRNQIDLANDVTGILPSANLDADTAHLTEDQTFSGKKTFSAAITASSNISASGNISASIITAPTIYVNDIKGNGTIHLEHPNGTFGLAITTDSDPNITTLNGGGLHFSAEYFDFNNHITASNNISASGTISGSNIVKSFTNGGSNNVVRLTLQDGTNKDVTVNNVVNATNATNAGCSDRVKTITCTANAERFITFVDDNNAPDEACETVKTAEFLRVNCRERTLIVEGKIKVKGSDITMESGSISASGAITASGDISSSGNFFMNNIGHVGSITASGDISMSGLGSVLTSTTGSFNHIITDGDTIEFRQKGSTTKLGSLKFTDDGASFDDAAGSGKTNLTASIVLAETKFVSKGSAELAGNVTMSGEFSASGAVYTQKVKTNRMASISPDGDILQFSENNAGTRIHGMFINLGDPLESNQHVTASGNISSSGHTIAKHFSTYPDGDPINGKYNEQSASFHYIFSGGDVSASGTVHGKSINVTDNINTHHITASGNIYALGNIIAQQYIVSSSVTHLTQSFSSGSTVFGDSADDTHVFTGNITASNNISASGTIFGTLGTAAQPNITSLGTLTTLTVDDITINGSTISDSGNFTLDVGGDITLDAAGDQIYMKDNGTTRFTFNLDSTPEIDIDGDLILDPTGGDVKVDGRLQTYANASYPNYAIGGGQGYADSLFFAGNRFQGASPAFVAYSSGSIEATKDVNAFYTFAVPNGYRLVGCTGVANYTTSIILYYGRGFCESSEVANLSAITCPNAGLEALQSNAVNITSANILSTNNADMCQIMLKMRRGEIFHGIYFMMSPLT